MRSCAACWSTKNKESSDWVEKLLTTAGSDTWLQDWLYSCQDMIAGGGLVPSEVCSLHCHSYIVFIVLAVFTDCKSTTKKLSAKVFRENISENRVKSPKSCLLRGRGRGRNDPFRNRNVLPDRPQFCFASSRLFTTFGLVTIL